ncbi:hypothetical protein Lal_00039074 [Lupinus albus]|nr:hypothetical protein Lal_00039074 [Lupinus albus]
MTITNSCVVFFLFFIMPHPLFSHAGIYSGPSTHILHSSHANRNCSITESVREEHATSTTSRNFLLNGSCTKRDISISQSKGSTSGIPQYIVQIVNTCISECAPHDIHLHCGWFASARIINPRLFKRVKYDDCLVNEGNHLASTQIIRFTYSNSFMYPLAFKSAKFC